MHTFDGVYLHVNIFCYVCYIFIHQFKKKNGKLWKDWVEWFLLLFLILSHDYRVCVSQSPRNVPKAEFVYLGVPKVSLKQSLCISESPKCP